MIVDEEPWEDLELTTTKRDLILDGHVRVPPIKEMSTEEAMRNIKYYLEKDKEDQKTESSLEKEVLNNSESLEEMTQMTKADKTRTKIVQTGHPGVSTEIQKVTRGAANKI